jgi:Protein of unknown function (DUF3159)
VTAAPDPATGRPTADDEAAPAPLFDRHLVLEQLGGWRGMLDATLPTIAFVVGNSLGGLVTGIWAAAVAALLVFFLRLVRRESVQQAISGLFAVAVAVAIAFYTGQARDFFVFGIVRNAAIALVLYGSIALRRPLVGYAAEFLAPSHLGAMASHSLPGMRRRIDRVDSALHHRTETAPQTDPATGRRTADPEPERHWRDDPRMLRAYSWLTVLWGATFALRVVVQLPLYRENEVEWLATVSLVLGLPLTGLALAITLWVVARLHRHRSEPAAPAPEPGPGMPADGERPAA